MPNARIFSPLTLSFLITMSFATPAYAYLDPGTGSIILQGIIASIAMISLTAKMYWYKLTSFFRKSDPLEVNDEEESEEAPKSNES